MATAKAKTTGKAKKPASKTTKTAAAKTVAAPKTERVDMKINKAGGSSVKEFFARKYDAKENILTIFKSPKIVGACLGEIAGTMLLAMILLTLGVYQPIYLIFGIIAITIAVYGFSGANLNPLITVGMMASRRMSPIRGTLYIISQVLGAWFGFLIVSAFYNAAPESGTAVMPTIAEQDGGMFWPVTMVEFMCASVIGFFFARALAYKRSVFTFAAVVGGGLFTAVIFAIVVTSALALQDAFVLNPAVAIMYQILPNAGADFGELLGKVGLALSTYVLFPALGGVVGFYISDLVSKFSGEKVTE